MFTGKALLPGDYLSQMTGPHPGPASITQWNPLQWDAIAQYYPWRVFYARSMRQGHIPLWNPHQFSGTPFLANGQSAVLYPPNLLFLVFDPITAFTVLAVLHLFLAASFMYMLLRALGTRELGGIIGAITFAFSAFMVLWLELPTFVGAAVWLPLTLLLIYRAVEKKSIYFGMLSGLALSMAFLAGHLQIAFYVAFAAVLWWLWQFIAVWRSESKIDAVLYVAVPAAACVIIAGLIAAPQVLPSQELAAKSHRVREVSEEGYERFISNAAAPYRLITAFAPDYFGSPGKNNYLLLGKIGDHIGSAADYMEYGMYAGVISLLLAFVAICCYPKRAYQGFFIALAGLSLLLAAGTDLNRIFYFCIPGFSALGGPNRILLLYLFSVSALAAVGADYISEHAVDAMKIYDRRNKLRKTSMGFVIGFGALCGAGVICGALSIISRTALESLPEQIRASVDIIGEASWALVLAWSVVFAVLAGLYGSRRLSPRSFACLLLAIVAADLFVWGINYNLTCDRSQVYPETRLVKELKRIAGHDRIAVINSDWNLWETPKAILPPNAAMVYGLYDTQGYDSLYTKTYKDLSSDVQGVDSSPPENGNMVLFRRYSPDIAKLARFVVTKAELTDQNAKLVAQADGARIYELARAPRGQVTDQHYDSSAFRLGLFLMLFGVGILIAVGVYRRISYNIHRKQ